MRLRWCCKWIPPFSRCVADRGAVKNGHGKSTLVKLILGELAPTKGTVLRHPLMKVGYFSQHSVEELSKETTQTPLAYFIDYFEKKGVTVNEGEARRSLAGLGLAGSTVSNTSMSALSGGQKVRLALSLIIHNPPSVLYELYLTIQC